MPVSCTLCMYEEGTGSVTHITGSVCTRYLCTKHADYMLPFQMGPPGSWSTSSCILRLTSLSGRAAPTSRPCSVTSSAVSSGTREGLMNTWYSRPRTAISTAEKRSKGEEQGSNRQVCWPQPECPGSLLLFLEKGSHISVLPTVTFPSGYCSLIVRSCCKVTGRAQTVWYSCSLSSCCQQLRGPRMKMGSGGDATYRRTQA